MTVKATFCITGRRQWGEYEVNLKPVDTEMQLKGFRDIKDVRQVGDARSYRFDVDVETNTRYDLEEVEGLLHAHPYFEKVEKVRKRRFPF